MENRTLTVTQLNGIVKALVDSEPLLTNLSVRGELSNYKIYPSGHHYFTLKDKESSVRCVMFKSSASKLRFKPESGMSVTAAGRISVYPRDGAYQLYCTGLMPEGAGDLHVAFEQLKARLDEEGLFDPSLKKPIPAYPETIAVVTSSAGAAVRDIIRVASRRWPLTKIIILPVRVQGAEAPAEIAGALYYANKYSIAELIITGRGGGSIEDLWAFNDERVARAIFASEIPVISAVGHEPDVTISDYVADLRAATPSNAAELATPDRAELEQGLSSAGKRLERSVTKLIGAYANRLEEIRTRRTMQTPAAYVDIKRVELDAAQNCLISVSGDYLSKLRHGFTRLAATMDAISPIKVLARGYSIATGEDGAVIKDCSDISPGEKLTLRLSRGGLRCTVDERIRRG